MTGRRERWFKEWDSSSVDGDRLHGPHNRRRTTSPIGNATVSRKYDVGRCFDDARSTATYSKVIDAAGE